MQSDGTDSPGMHSLTWADTPVPGRVRPGVPRQQHAAILDDLGGGREFMAGALAYLFAAGAVIMLVLFAVLDHEQASTPGMIAVVCAALAIGAGIEIAGELIPEQAYPWLLAAASVLISAAVYFRGIADAPHAFFYVWIACFSFYFFPRGIAMAQVGFAAASYGLALALLPH